MLGAGPALGAEVDSGAIETVVVTAEKRPENVQSVGLSITAYSGEQLERANITSVADLATRVPSLTINQSNNNRNSQVEIRNVGTSGTNPGTEPDVGIFLDGVFIPVGGPIYSEISDISTVEVLRGPQGTLYGRNTPVGAINITTQAPTQDTQAGVTVQYGNYNLVRATGFLNGGITDDLAGRLSVWKDSHSGYLTNLYTNAPVWNGDKYGGRGRLQWTPDADTVVDIIGYYSYMTTDGTNGVQVNPLGPGGIVFGYSPTPVSFAASPFVIAQKATNPTHPYVVPGPWQVNSATPAFNQTAMWGVSAQVSRNLPGIDATLVDLAAYNSYFDFSPNVGPGQLPLDLATNAQRDLIGSTSNELRLVSNGTHFLDYVAGVYVFHDDLGYRALLTIDSQANRVYPKTNCGGVTTCSTNQGDRSDLNYHQYTNAAAVYGQATAHLTDDLRLIGGLRYSYDHKGSQINQTLSNVGLGTVSAAFLFNQTGSATGPKTAALSGKLTDHSLTWLAGAQYDVMTDVMLYATASNGFKDGGFNSRSASATPYVFNPETSLNYEVGIKSLWFDNRLLVNLDAFRMLVHGYQQSTLLPTGSGFVIGNAGNFQNQGFELDSQIHPIDPLSINVSGSFIDSLITGGAEHATCDSSYPFAGSSPPASSGKFFNGANATNGCNFDGLTLPYAPKWHWSVGARWEQPWMNSSNWNWFVSGTLSGQSSEYMDATLDPRSFQSAYMLFDASAGVEDSDGRWRIDLWGKNLGNERYFTTEAAQTQGAQINGGGTAAANGFIGWLAVPRTFGVEGSYRF